MIIHPNLADSSLFMLNIGLVSLILYQTEQDNPEDSLWHNNAMATITLIIVLTYTNSISCYIRLKAYTGSGLQFNIQKVNFTNQGRQKNTKHEPPP